MRDVRGFLSVGSFVLAAACGGKVEGGSTSAAVAPGTVDGGDGVPSSAPAGCPLTMPTGGQRCVSTMAPDALEHFYCHYFPTGSACPAEWKCTEKGTGALTFVGGSGGCPLKVDDCNEGKPCGVVFEQSGACLVECARVCRCDAATGTLRCAATVCAGGGK